MNCALPCIPLFRSQGNGYNYFILVIWITTHRLAALRARENPTEGVRFQVGKIKAGIFGDLGKTRLEGDHQT